MSEYEQNFQIIEKQRQDINELNVVRSKLQNEIEAKREEARLQAKKIADDVISQAKDEAGKILKQARLEQEKVIAMQEGMAKEKQDVYIEHQELNKLMQELSEKEKKFIECQEQESKRLASERAKIEAVQMTVDKITKENANTVEFLLSKKNELDNREYRLGIKKEETDKLMEKAQRAQMEVDLALSALKTEKTSIREETQLIKDKIVELQKITEENKQLLSLKDDIAKAEALKKEIEAKSLQLQESSKALALKEEKLREREQSNKEREQLIQIESRKLDEKIATLKKLREEMQKSNV